MPDPNPARHLVTVWNPAYADAMDETIQVLLARVRDHRAGALPEEDDVFVWWGKVKSTNRQKPLPHLAEILDIDRELTAEGGVEREIHLYITDFRSLYVGHVAEITADDVRRENDGGIPTFYGRFDLDCDCWFKLFDIRRIVFDDTVAVVDELRKLHNTRYNDRPVSIYGGMVDLPIIATRKDDAHFFGPDVRESLTDGQYWVEFDAQRTGTGRMERDLRDNLVGESAWTALDPSARLFIATAETLFREHRDDPAFDFAPVVIGFAKAFEVQVNMLLRTALSSVAPKDRTFIIEGRPTDIASGQLLLLGQLARLLGQEESLNSLLKKLLIHGEWFTAQLPPILKDLSGMRNPAAHTERVSARQAGELRNRILGVGQPAVLVDLGRVRRK